MTGERTIVIVAMESAPAAATIGTAWVIPTAVEN
jgi:hypothetical protein